MWLTRKMAKKFSGDSRRRDMGWLFAERKPPDRVIDTSANLGSNNKDKSDPYL